MPRDSILTTLSGVASPYSSFSDVAVSEISVPPSYNFQGTAKMPSVLSQDTPNWHRHSAKPPSRSDHSIYMADS